MNITRLAMLAKDMDATDEGVFSNSCHLCGKRFTCLHRHRVCSYCGYYFCHQCAPHTLPLGSKNEDKPVGVSNSLLTRSVLSVRRCAVSCIRRMNSCVFVGVEVDLVMIVVIMI